MQEESKSRLRWTAFKNFDQYMEREANKFCQKYDSYDLSNVGVGELNLCDYKVIALCFSAYLDMEDERPIKMSIIQNYFTRKRTAIILD